MTPEDFLHLTFIPSGILLGLKMTSAIISFLMLAAIIFFIKKTGWFTLRYSQDMKEFLSFKPIESRKYEKLWGKIKQRLEINSESELKLAIIEADNLLMDILGKLGYQGKTSQEKLGKITADILPNMQDVLDAHQIRNHIIYDPNYRITLDKTQEVINIYEKAMQDLGLFS